LYGATSWKIEKPFLDFKSDSRLSRKDKMELRARSQRFWSPTLTRKAAQRAGVCDACSRGEFGEVLHQLSSEGTEDVGIARMADGSNALHFAAAAHRHDVVAALLAKRPDLATCARRDGWLPLHSAASALGSVPSVLRTEETACIAESPTSAARRHAETVALLLQGNASAAMVRGQLDRRSPLHIALLTRAPCSVVLALLAAAPAMVCEPLRDVYSHKKGEGGETPLHTAILRGVPAPTLVRMVEVGGATGAGQLNSRGETPLHCAIAMGSPLTIVAALVAVSPLSVGRRNRSNETAFDLAVRHSASLEAFETMLAASPKPTWLPGNGGKSLIERLVHDHASIPGSGVYAAAVLRAAPAVARKVKSGPMSPLLHLALRRGAPPALVDALLRAAPAIASSAVLDRSGDCAAKCAVAWYTRGEACSLADALLRAMRERRGPRCDAPLAAWSAQREVSFLSSTVTFYANLAHSLTRSPYHL
jgi:ankyrin repeat protein